VVKFVAKNIAVDTSDLQELIPPHLLPGHTINFSAKGKNGYINTITIKEDGALKYKLTKLAIKEDKLDSYFQGDFEPKLFKGADTIKGSTQGDILYGYNGNDQISGKAGDDAIYGGKGNDKLHGDDGGDTIFGDAGKDYLVGDTGVNSLTGGSGKDKFAFSAELAGGNYSEIADFVVGADKIELDKGTFEGVGGKGTLAAGKFFLADEYAGKAKSVIYDDTNGNLLYSKNGGDISNAQVFGRIANGAELSHQDFLIA
jgi:hypothetical protein